MLPPSPVLCFFYLEVNFYRLLFWPSFHSIPFTEKKKKSIATESISVLSNGRKSERFVALQALTPPLLFRQQREAPFEWGEVLTASRLTFCGTPSSVCVCAYTRISIKSSLQLFTPSLCPPFLTSSRVIQSFPVSDRLWWPYRPYSRSESPNEESVTQTFSRLLWNCVPGKNLIKSAFLSACERAFGGHLFRQGSRSLHSIDLRHLRM